MTRTDTESEAPAEDWSSRVFGPKSWPQHLWFLARAFENYSENELDSLHRYGDVVRVRMPYRGVMFFHPRHVKHVLRSNVLNYPKSRDYDMLRPLIGDGIFVSEGDLWTRQRRLMAPEFQEKTVARFAPIMIECAERLFAAWDRQTGSDPVDVNAAIMRLTLWIAGRAMFKNEFQADAEIIGDALGVMLEHATFRMHCMGFYKSWFPTPGNLESKRAEKRMNGVIQRIIQDGRDSDGGDYDVLSRMIRAKDPETGASMSNKQLLDETKSLILAGHESTSLALSWSLYLLARHPDVMRRLVDEVTRVLGDSVPAAEHVPRLQYTRMVFLETLRLYPSVPSVPRRVAHADVVDGIRLEPGEVALISAYATHRHPEFWPDPDRFDPERFALDRLDAIEPFSYFPFLIGRRACIGEHFAMLEGVLMLAMLVRRYDLALASTEPMRVRPMITLRFARPLMMRITRRL